LKDQRAREIEDSRWKWAAIKADADMQMEALRSQLEDQTSLLESIIPHAR
jgi:hypothetical protein